MCIRDSCGDGDFIGLLLELGIDTVGVDSDEKAFSAAKEKNLPVVCQDVLTYLEELPDNSVDGIFSATWWSICPTKLYSH